MKAWDMESTRFDSLTRSLHDMRSRRAVLATLLSSALATVGVTAVADAKGKVKTQGSGGQKSKWRCRRPGTTCFRKPKKGSASEKRDCKFCCSGSFRQLSTS